MCFTERASGAAGTGAGDGAVAGATAIGAGVLTGGTMGSVYGARPRGDAGGARAMVMAAGTGAGGKATGIGAAAMDALNLYRFIDTLRWLSGRSPLRLSTVPGLLAPIPSRIYSRHEFSHERKHFCPVIKIRAIEQTGSVNDRVYVVSWKRGLHSCHWRCYFHNVGAVQL